MTKILNLDKIETKREIAIILNGKEHVMKTLTVKEYLYHMKEAEKLAKVDEDNIDSLGAGLEATIKILLNAFPTVTQEEFEGLSLQQLDAIRGLVEETSDADLEDKEPNEGEAKAAEGAA